MVKSRTMQVESALFFESIEEIYTRVFKDLKPRTRTPEFAVEFCRFANPDCFAHLDQGHIRIRLSDLFAGAPAPVMEALAYILLSKLFRRPVEKIYSQRYRLYLNRRDVTRTAHLVRQIRGRKFLSGPQGEHHNLDEIFEALNLEYFGGLMARPQLGWSRNRSRTLLGHFDPSHNAIIISRLLDSDRSPKLALEYVVYHEMLHLRHPVETRGTRRSVHTRDFRAAEKQFRFFKEARLALKKLR
jgi:hypothetical protein